MLRILTFDEPTTLKLRFEGQLDELSRLDFRRALASAEIARGSRKLLLDVGNLVLDGTESERTFLSSRPPGAIVVDATGRIAQLLQEQEQQECNESCGLLRRVAFALSTICQSSSRFFCAKVYRLLHSRP